MNESGVRYLLVGGYAVGYHGYPRSTADMGVWVAVSPSSAERIVAALKAFGFDVPGLHPELFLRENGMVRMGHPPLRHEILMQIDGVEFEVCYDARVDVDFGGLTVPVISKEHLRQNKKASGRPKDLADLDHLP